MGFLEQNSPGRDGVKHHDGRNIAPNINIVSPSKWLIWDDWLSSITLFQQVFGTQSTDSSPSQYLLRLDKAWRLVSTQALCNWAKTSKVQRKSSPIFQELWPWFLSKLHKVQFIWFIWREDLDVSPWQEKSRPEVLENRVWFLWSFGHSCCVSRCFELTFF